MSNIEQIKYLRNRANISYEEASKLINKYDGDMVKILCELENEGKLFGAKNENRNRSNQKKDKTFSDDINNLLKKGEANRFIVKNGEEIIVNLSINYMILFVIFGNILVIISLVGIFALGYTISFTNNNKESFKDEFEKSSEQQKNQYYDSGETKKENIDTEKYSVVKEIDNERNEIIIE